MELFLALLALFSLFLGLGLTLDGRFLFGAFLFGAGIIFGGFYPGILNPTEFCIGSAGAFGIPLITAYITRHLFHLENKKQSKKD